MAFLDKPGREIVILKYYSSNTCLLGSGCIMWPTLMFKNNVKLSFLNNTLWQYRS